MMSFTRRDVDLNLGVYSIRISFVIDIVDKKPGRQMRGKRSGGEPRLLFFFLNSGSLLLLYSAIWSAYYRSLDIYMRVAIEKL